MSDFIRIRDKLRVFAEERDWDQFHTPKNLLMAMTGEVGELCEQLQWMTDQQVLEMEPDRKQEVTDEVADVLIYLIRLADKLEVDLSTAVMEKMEQNARKYPVDQVRGSSKKYTEYGD